MAGRLIGSWNPSLNANGEPISGAKLVTWQAGSTTPKQTFQDAALTTPHQNPVVADSAGRFAEIWAADGATYDLKWTDASDVQIDLFENIQALGSTVTGAVTRDFGADGRFNLESRGGVFEIEAGDASPDNLGGTARIGGWNGSQGDTLTLDFQTVKVSGTLAGTAQRGAIGGLTMSTAGAVSTFGVAVGQATDSTGLVSIILPAAFTKTTASWAAGTANGALDTGSIAINTWYHAYLIRRADNGLVDVIVSTSATAPTLPSGYTQYRYIGSMRTDGSSHWRKFIQLGDVFLWDVPIAEAGGAIGTTSANYVVTVPLGFSVTALFSANLTNASAASAAIIYSPLQSAQTPTTVTGNFNLYALTVGQAAPAAFSIVTDTAQHIAACANAASSALAIASQGYINPRGKDV